MALTKQQEDIRQKIAEIPMDAGDMADNFAIALCTYFSDHPDRPEDDEDGETGWGEWVEQQYNRVMDAIASDALLLACELERLRAAIKDIITIIPVSPTHALEVAHRALGH